MPPRLAVLTAPQIGRPASSGRPAWLLGCSTPSGGGLWLFRAWLRTLKPPSAYARVAHSSAFGRPGKLIKLLSGAGEEKDDAGEVTVSASLTPTLLTVAGTIALGAAARSKVNVPPRVLVPQLDRPGRTASGLGCPTHSGGAPQPLRPQRQLEVRPSASAKVADFHCL